MELFFRKFGQGVPLIIIHGLYGSSDNWVSIGRKLGEHFEVFLLDQRNHGRSPHSSLHNYELMAGDLKEFMDGQQIDKAILMGHSMGGKTVMYFAAEFPDRVNHLIVLDIAPKAYSKLAKNQDAVLSHYNILSTLKSVDFSQIKSRAQLDVFMAKSIKNDRIRSFLMKNAVRNKENSFSWRLNIDALIENCDIILDGFDITNYKKGKGLTGFPVLFIKGENSPYISDKDVDLIKILFPYAEIKVIKQAGHWLHAEQPQKLLQMILEFVKD